jgi:aspartate racemase
MVGSNTSHLAAEAIGAATALPFLHVQDALVAAMRARGIGRPLLTGTKVTMSGPFYRASLARRFDGDVATPSAAEQDEIERIVFDELCLGVVTPASRARFREIVAAHPDCDGVILGCTELSLILAEGEVSAPVLDTTALHAAAGVDFALADR